MSLFFEKEYVPAAASWGWFCVYLKMILGDAITIIDHFEHAKVRLRKLGDTKYMSGEDTLDSIFDVFCCYCATPNPNFDDGAEEDEDFKKAKNKWQEMLTVVTVEKYGFVIKKYSA